MTSQLQRGRWITFHPTQPGRVLVGQISGALEPNQWGRPCYRVEFWKEKTAKGKTSTVRATDTIASDRVIGTTTQPTGMAELIRANDEGQAP